MAETASSGPNRRIGSIERVGEDGFIVEAADPSDPSFIGGKRLFPNFDELLRFLAKQLQVYKSSGNRFGIKDSKTSKGGNGVSEEVQQEGV
jgi:hypothetical protein